MEFYFISFSFSLVILIVIISLRLVNFPVKSHRKSRYSLAKIDE